MQGQLLNQNLTVTIMTSCAHCNRPMQLLVSSDLEVEVVQGGAEPLLTAPLMDLARLKDPSIIDAF